MIFYTSILVDIDNNNIRQPIKIIIKFIQLCLGCYSLTLLCTPLSFALNERLRKMLPIVSNACSSVFERNFEMGVTVLFH